MSPFIDEETKARGISRWPAPTRIYLARHGRTALNASGVLRGQIDVGLDSVGQQQVSRLGAALAGKRPRLVVSSPLLRAVETAEAIASRAHTGTWVDERLTDRYYGEWAGARVEDVIARWGSLGAAPGVEPAEEVRERALAALTDIAQNSRAMAAVVVSHDAVNRIALAAMGSSLGPPDDLPQDTACFNTIEYEVDDCGSVKWRVVSVNEIVRQDDNVPPTVAFGHQLGNTPASREATGGP